MRKSDRKITVSFKRTSPQYHINGPARRYGGCGVLTVPPMPYIGPAVMQFEAVVGRELVRFVATRIGHSPTHSCHGSFRIDELAVDRRGEQRLITIGYNCSWPDAEVCRRLAVEYRQS